MTSAADEKALRDSMIYHILEGKMDELRDDFARGNIADFEVPGGTDNITPVMAAIRANAPEALEMLLKAGAKADTVSGRERETPLVYVLKHFQQNARLAALLLEHGASPDQVGGLSEDRPLLLAAKEGQGEILRLLIDAKADVNATCDSRKNAAHYAAEGGFSEVIPLLAAAGVNIDALDARNELPLNTAIDKNHSSAAIALLECGADPALSPKGMSPLMGAAWAGDMMLMRTLIERGVPLDTQYENNQYTALHYAAHRGRTTAVQALLEAGADPSLKDHNGLTPAQLAEARGNAATVKAMHETVDREFKTGLKSGTSVAKPFRIVILPGAKP